MQISNQSALGGSLSSELFLDALQLHESFIEEGGWREWSTCSTDGDTAALLELVHDHKVRSDLCFAWVSNVTRHQQLQFRFDTRHARTARQELDWNSRKAGMLIGNTSQSLSKA